jgi:hypothetical protein
MATTTFGSSPVRELTADMIAAAGCGEELG